MVKKCRRFGRMAVLLLQGEISLHIFRTGLRADVIAVCRKHGGMVFCQASAAAVYFEEDRG